MYQELTLPGHVTHGRACQGCRVPLSIGARGALPRFVNRYQVERAFSQGNIVALGLDEVGSVEHWGDCIFKRLPLDVLYICATREEACMWLRRLSLITDAEIKDCCNPPATPNSPSS